jgi:hypothetical protein
MAPVGDARVDGRRRRQRLGQHGEAGEQQRRIEQRLAQGLTEPGRGRGGERDRQICEHIATDHVETLHLAHDQQATEQDERQERDIAAHPPGRRLVQQQRRGGNADRHRIEDMFAPDRQYEFRGDSHHAGQDQPGIAHQVRCGDRRHDQDENERRDMDRFGVHGDAQREREQAVGRPAPGDYERGRPGQRQRIVRRKAEEAQDESGGQQAGGIIEHQPVHGDAVERPVDDVVGDAHVGAHDGAHDSTKALKPLVWVAMPVRSTT